MFFRKYIEREEEKKETNGENRKQKTYFWRFDCILFLHSDLLL